MGDIEELIQNALDQDYNKASDVFSQVMSAKTQEGLDQAKIKIAGQLYNGEEPDGEDEDLASMSDEEIDDEIGDLDDEISDDEIDEEDEEDN